MRRRSGRDAEVRCEVSLRRERFLAFLLADLGLVGLAGLCCTVCCVLSAAAAARVIILRPCIFNHSRSLVSRSLVSLTHARSSNTKHKEKKI